MVFLGMLLDGVHKCLCIPIEKRNKALNLLMTILNSKKATVKQVQQLTGILNFLSRAIVPGRAFTRRMYAKINLSDSKGRKLRDHHHVKIDQEFKNDYTVWISFLQDRETKTLCRPFIDLNKFETSETLQFYSDASGKIGFGAIFNKKWLFGLWNQQFLRKKPSIEYLELYALCCGVITWQEHLQNTRIIVFCDNQVVVEMINNTTSKCPNCMILIRLLMINNLKHNRRVSVKYVPTKQNFLADALSRNQLKQFHKLVTEVMDQYPTQPSNILWPVEKIWCEQF